MQDKFQKIYVGTNEGITSVVDCLVNSVEKDILLIIPPENKNFQNLITLKLLKREARTLGKNIVLISSSSIVKKLASRSGLRVIDYFQVEEIEPEIFYEKSSETGRVSDILSPPRRPHFPPSPEEPSLGGALEGKEESEKIKKEKLKFLEKIALKKEPSFVETAKVEEKEKKEEGEEESVEEESPKKGLSFFGNKFFVGIFVLIGLGVVGFAFLSLPKARVEITPKINTISFDLAIKLDKEISELDLSQKKIPAQLIRIEREVQNLFLSSGKKLKESKAGGTITVYNNYNSSPQPLVATTRFISENGKLFRTTSTITVPGAGVSGGKTIPSTCDVKVIAAETGEDYNIGPSTFSIPGFAGTPKYTGFYGKSVAPMSGGFRGEVKFATKDDVEEAKKSLEEQLSVLDREISSKIPQNLKLVEGASELKFEELSSPKAGDENEKFEISIRGIISALVFNEGDVKKLIEEDIANKIVVDKKSLPKTQKISYSVKSINLKDGKADFSIKVDEGIVWAVDIESIRKNLISKNIPEVKEYLSSLVSIENAKVTLWPFWVKEFPSDSDKIEVEIVL
ncbi:MAG: hypothetical protein COV69_02680 [Parcubacteria group bacterium CG11_big_fil_rev_8_21_14_0_20_39_14]|nr:MAG: hypothetical protein COV69_02680 [Parcubacteria group bacterium CG11_big_fil_rev_8_21_14_0_20_39_14]PIS35042.1 MAG: hypothetical protein COT36_04540 [Parcubacteria group bacterium CG08_land_8_20_14_0_20_38_56]